MNFEKVLKPTGLLRSLASQVEKSKQKRVALNDRLQEQLEIVRNAEERLAEFVNARRVKTDNPEEIQTASKACKAQAKIVADEQEVLDAISTAMRNSDEQISQAGNSYASSLRKAVSDAAQSAKDQIRSNLLDAMREYFACHCALRGTIIGAQYEVEQLSYDQSLGKDAGKRISDATVSLRDAVNKSALQVGD